MAKVKRSKKRVGAQVTSSGLRSFTNDSPIVKLLKETSQHSDLRRELIRGIEKRYKAKVITYFTSFSNAAGMVSDDDAEMLESLLAVEHEKGGRLILLINSAGGMALAAERIVNVCRAYSGDRFEVLVPHMAKSAATMICFGAAKIHMSATAELGPVDPQVAYPLGDKSHWISAQEYIRSYERLMERGISGDAKRLEPLLLQLSKYDARYIEQLKSAQKLSEDISVKLLRSFMMKKVGEATIRQKITPFLSQEETGSHGRMISASEAIKCGLKVQMIDLRSDVWNLVWELYVRSDWTVSNRCAKIIESGESALNL